MSYDITQSVHLFPLFHRSRMAAVDTNLKPCGFCGTMTTMRCSYCKLVYYCRPDHQRLDWKVHKPLCNPPTPSKYSIVFNPRTVNFDASPTPTKKRGAADTQAAASAADDESEIKGVKKPKGLRKSPAFKPLPNETLLQFYKRIGAMNPNLKDIHDNNDYFAEAHDRSTPKEQDECNAEYAKDPVFAAKVDMLRVLNTMRIDGLTAKQNARHAQAPAK